MHDRLNRTTVECKLRISTNTGLSLLRLNRTTVECKYKSYDSVKY